MKFKNADQRIRMLRAIFARYARAGLMPVAKPGESPFAMNTRFQALRNRRDDEAVRKRAIRRLARDAKKRIAARKRPLKKRWDGSPL